MCVVALAYDVHPRWLLVLAGNRDEYHARPAIPAGRWAEAPHVFGGRDLQAGGSWLGVSEQGRLAVVTNIRNPEGPDPAKASRGALVGDWLIDGKAHPVDDFGRFNPFNLLLFGAAGMTLLSNLPEPAQAQLGPGIHGLSNGHPGEAWPRRSLAETGLAQWIEAEGGTPDDLFALLRDEGIADDVGQPIFINAPVYGTRCSTVILIGRDGTGWIAEHSFDADGSDTVRTNLDFRWPVAHGG